MVIIQNDVKMLNIYLLMVITIFVIVIDHADCFKTSRFFISTVRSNTKRNYKSNNEHTEINKLAKWDKTSNCVKKSQEKTDNLFQS